MEEIKGKVQKILQEFGDTHAKEQEENRNLLDVIQDSISYIKFIVKMEEAFDIEFEDDKLDGENFENIEDIYCYVDKLLREK